MGDWITPFPADALLSRGMHGGRSHRLPIVLVDGPRRRLPGDIEVEIFNGEIWAADPAATLATVDAPLRRARRCPADLATRMPTLRRPTYRYPRLSEDCEAFRGGGRP